MEEERVAEFKRRFGIDYIFCCYADEGLQKLAKMMTYRVERAQYKLLQALYGDLTWEEYLYYLSESEQMKDNARRAIIEAQRDFGADQFNFEAIRPTEDGEEVCMIRLFEGEQIRAASIFFLFKAELAQYHQLCKIRGEDYTLECYMQDLWEDEALVAALRRGFEDSVDRLDFEAAWQKVDYDLTDDLFE